MSTKLMDRDSIYKQKVRKVAGGSARTVREGHTPLTGAPYSGVMPEGDTILRAARRIRPVLEGAVPDEILMPQARHARDCWPERLRGRAVTRVDTHGKHLFLRFEGDLVLHSHLRMTGAWAVYRHGARWRRAPRRAWLVMRARGHDVVEFDGPVLELMTDGRTRFDQRLAALGPDVLAEPAFDADRFLEIGRA